MVYTCDGLALPHAFDYIGNNVNHIYDINGNLLPNLLKIMTYNVGEWYIGDGTNVPAEDDQIYYDLQNGMIATQNPDILFIQEYWKVFSQTGRTAKSLLEQYSKT